LSGRKLTTKKQNYIEYRNLTWIYSEFAALPDFLKTLNVKCLAIEMAVFLSDIFLVK